MPSILANTVQAPPRIRCETPQPTMAKADLTIREKRAVYGAILRRASEIAGLNRDETARALGGIDPAQVSRWWSGDENPQTWRYTPHEALGPALLLAQAERQHGVTVRMQIELERKAGER